MFVCVLVRVVVRRCVCPCVRLSVCFSVRMFLCCLFCWLIGCLIVCVVGVRWFGCVRCCVVVLALVRSGFLLVVRSCVGLFAWLFVRVLRVFDCLCV